MVDSEEPWKTKTEGPLNDREPVILDDPTPAGIPLMVGWRTFLFLHMS